MNKREMPELLYERINQCLIDNNITKREAAVRIGVERKSMYNYANGDTVPSAMAIVRMCYLFNVSADWLLGVKRR